MSTSLIIVGLNEWDRFTRPCVESVIEHDPGMSILIVDNGSTPPYEQHRPCYRMVRNAVKGSYAQGLNIGLKNSNKADWYVLTNNDVLFNKYISGDIRNLDPHNLYGFMLYDKVFTQPYLSGWFLIVSGLIYETIGGFDEEFKPMWFEDADYSFRAAKADFGLVELNREEWGVEHLERKGERAPLIANNIRERKLNRERLYKKHGIKPL